MADKKLEPIFIDSSYFKAVIDAKDEFYKNAKSIWGKISKSQNILITSNYILDESFTLIRIRCGIKMLQEFRDWLAESGNEIKISRVTISDEAKAWDWILEDWSNLSFTDCVSFALMERLKIKNVATFDNHFSQAGFKILS